MAEADKGDLDLGKGKEDKPSKVLLYVVIALIVIVLGMGGVLLYVTGVIKLGSGGESEEHAEAEAPPPPREPLYLPLDRDMVVNLPPGSEARLLQVGVTVLAYDPRVADVLKKHMPMLRNNLGVLLAGQNPAELKKTEGKQALQAKVLEEVNKVIQQQLPDAAAEQVFFTSFILQ
ncbi:flagellar basal body-associated FliL family protein [Methylogaea oryzae]|uniref:Flagellar protein FliL n=1 Tax=Methylogaea oryzae TaxID=1295382 RepID=A0A8D4VP69_9GAMM|nr:flagellar basal body-associated FliL family protein [Methylogaea oryzae]BBL71508.1 hypothetical protein MoryE10_21140 [Methylogaea oryzae]